jgi:hypothetical protein
MSSYAQLCLINRTQVIPKKRNIIPINAAHDLPNYASEPVED